jgi:hypothetical protein
LAGIADGRSDSAFWAEEVAARLAVAAFAHEAVGLRARDILREAGRVRVSVSRTLLALRE